MIHYFIPKRPCSTCMVTDNRRAIRRHVSMVLIITYFHMISGNVCDFDLLTCLIVEGNTRKKVEPGN